MTALFRLILPLVSAYPLSKKKKWLKMLNLTLNVLKLCMHLIASMHIISGNGTNFYFLLEHISDSLIQSGTIVSFFIAGVWMKIAWMFFWSALNKKIYIAKVPLVNKNKHFFSPDFSIKKGSVKKKKKMFIH